MRGEASAAEARVRREIARRMLAVVKEYVGRGPSNARAYFSEDLVVVLLEETLTKGERTLAEGARAELVRELRRTLQDTMRGEFERIVEEETGRQVRASLSDHSVLPDYAVEAFLLEAEDSFERDSGPEGLRVGSEAGSRQGHREISRGMVALYKEYIGRGPTRARTSIHDNLVTVLLEDTLTKAEKTLASDEERRPTVREIRRQFQGAMENDAVALVERQLQRVVVEAFMSDNSIEPDYAIEVFLLARAGEASVEAEAGA